MISVILPLFKKYYIHIILLALLGTLFVKNLGLREQLVTVREEVVQSDKLKNEAIQKAIVVEASLTSKYNEASAKREKYYAEQYKKLLDDYNSMQSATNSRLSSVTSKIRDRVLDPNTSTETRNDYINRYSQVVGECIPEYSKMARDLRTVGLERDQANERIDEIYSLWNEYKSLNEQTIIK